MNDVTDAENGEGDGTQREPQAVGSRKLVDAL